MPELPDVELYRHALGARVVGRELRQVRLASPFVLRSVDPPITATENMRVLDVQRLGKRIVLALEDDLYVGQAPGHHALGRVGNTGLHFEGPQALVHRGAAVRNGVFAEIPVAHADAGNRTSRGHVTVRAGR